MNLEFSGFFLVPLGLVLLAFGRKVFWLLVAATGFAVGWSLTEYFVGDVPEHVPLIAGIAIGLLGAFIAVIAQKIAILLGGFLAGGYAAMILLQNILPSLSTPGWIPFVIGGILGALLLKKVFEWTLIVLTSIVGGIFVLVGFQGIETVQPIYVLLLAALGVLFQSRSKKAGEGKGKE